METGDSPKVSVVITAFNHAETLPRAVSSVLMQTDVETEIIVVDDHSADPVIRQDLPAGEIQIVRTPENVGAGPARNVGAKGARHDILAFLDADDEWLPRSLRHRLAYCAPGRCVWGAYLERNDLTGAERRVAPRGNPSAWLHFENLISPSTLVMTVGDFWRVNGFPTDRRCAEDWILCLRALNAGLEFASITEPVTIKHQDLHNTTRDPHTTIEHALGAVRIMHEERLGTPEQLARARRIVNARAAAWSASGGQLRRSARYAAAALRGGPDPQVLRELLKVPVQYARGVARRTRDRRRSPHEPMSR